MFNREQLIKAQKVANIFVFDDFNSLSRTCLFIIKKKRKNGIKKSNQVRCKYKFMMKLFFSDELPFDLLIN
jgi:hypothetical protein